MGVRDEPGSAGVGIDLREPSADRGGDTGADHDPGDPRRDGQPDLDRLAGRGGAGVDQLVDHGGDRGVVGDDRDGGAIVGGLPACLEFADLAERVVAGQHRPGGPVTVGGLLGSEPGKRRLRADIQGDDEDARSAQQVVGPGVIGRHRTPTGHDDVASVAEGLAEQPPFGRAEGGFAVLGEDGRDIGPVVGLDHVVEVSQIPAQARGQVPADGRLARSTEPDEDQPVRSCRRDELIPRPGRQLTHDRRSPCVDWFRKGVSGGSLTRIAVTFCPKAAPGLPAKTPSGCGIWSVMRCPAGILRVA